MNDGASLARSATTSRRRPRSSGRSRSTRRSRWRSSTSRTRSFGSGDTPGSDGDLPGVPDGESHGTGRGTGAARAGGALAEGQAVRASSSPHRRRSSSSFRPSRQDADKRRGFSIRITAPVADEFVVGRTTIKAEVEGGSPVRRRPRGVPRQGQGDLRRSRGARTSAFTTSARRAGPGSSARSSTTPKDSRSATWSSRARSRSRRSRRSIASSSG